MAVSLCLLLHPLLFHQTTPHAKMTRSEIIRKRKTGPWRLSDLDELGALGRRFGGVVHGVTQEQVACTAASGRRSGAVALSLCTTAHPLHTRFAKRIGTSISEATMRPKPISYIHIKESGLSGSDATARMRRCSQSRASSPTVRARGSAALPLYTMRLEF